MCRLVALHDTISDSVRLERIFVFIRSLLLRRRTRVVFGFVNSGLGETSRNLVGIYRQTHAVFIIDPYFRC